MKKHTLILIRALLATLLATACSPPANVETPIPLEDAQADDALDGTSSTAEVTDPRAEDSDGDGIPDSLDWCPEEADRFGFGCPVTGGVLGDGAAVVAFERGTATVKDPERILDVLTRHNTYWGVRCVTRSLVVFVTPGTEYDLGLTEPELEALLDEQTQAVYGLARSAVRWPEQVRVWEPSGLTAHFTHWNEGWVMPEGTTFDYQRRDDPHIQMYFHFGSADMSERQVERLVELAEEWNTPEWLQPDARFEAHGFVGPVRDATDDPEGLARDRALAIADLFTELYGVDSDHIEIVVHGTPEWTSNETYQRGMCNANMAFVLQKVDP